MGEQLSNYEVVEFLQLISKHAKVRNTASYTYIRRTLEMLSIPFPVATVPKGRLLFRSRSHTKGEDFFNKIEDISCRQDLYYIEDFGRANEPSQSIFYCSDSNIVAFSETSVLTRQNTELPSDTVTTGVWEVQEDFQIATIISNHNIKGLNATIDGLDFEFKSLVKLYKNEGTVGHIETLELFSKEFTRYAQGNTSKYIVSCAFANYVYDAIGQSGKQVGGIMYSSAIYPNAGMNLAIKPELVFTEKIKLIAVHRGTMSLKDDANYYEEDVIEAKSINREKSAIEW